MGKWISVEDKLPNIEKGTFNVPVLIYPPFDESGGYASAPWAYYGSRFDGDINHFYIYGRQVFPTHWMPLPEPPNDD